MSADTTDARVSREQMQIKESKKDFHWLYFVFPNLAFSNRLRSIPIKEISPSQDLCGTSEILLHRHSRHLVIRGLDPANVKCIALHSDFRNVINRKGARMPVPCGEGSRRRLRERSTRLPKLRWRDAIRRSLRTYAKKLALLRLPLDGVEIREMLARQVGVSEPCLPFGSSIDVQVPPRTNFHALPWKSTVEVPWQVVPRAGLAVILPLEGDAITLLLVRSGSRLVFRLRQRSRGSDRSQSARYGAGKDKRRNCGFRGHRFSLRVKRLPP
jgi:hypothetical protein